MEKASKSLSLVSHFHSVTFIGVIFLSHVFSVFLSFISFFLVAAHKKDSFKDTHREKAPSKMKLQRLQKAQIWVFGLLVKQINSL